MKRNQSINEMTAANRIYCNSFSTRENRDLLETTINLLIWLFPHMWKKKFTHSNVRTQLLTISLPIKYALRWAKKICCHFVSRNVHLLIKSLHWIVWTDLSEIHNMVQHWVQWKAWNLTVISFCKCGCLANKHGVITVIANRPKEAGELILTIKLRPFCTWTIFFRL